MDAAPLEGLMSPADFERGVRRAALTDEACAAAARGDAKQLRLLLAAGADALAPDASGSTTPLVAALRSRIPACGAAAFARLAPSQGEGGDVDVAAVDVDAACGEVVGTW